MTTTTTTTTIIIIINECKILTHKTDSVSKTGLPASSSVGSVLYFTEPMENRTQNFRPGIKIVRFESKRN